MDLRDKFLGCLLGLAVGDALGRPFEGLSPTSAEIVESETRKIMSLRYTDDTEMTINLARSLVKKEGDLDLELIAKTFAQNFDPSRGYGPNTLWILQQIANGHPWENLAQQVMGGQGSFGNGAAMRVAPLALLYRGKELAEKVAEESRITHVHPLGIEGAILQAQAIRAALEHRAVDPLDFIDELHKWTTSNVFKYKLEAVKELLTSGKQEDVVQILGNGVEVFNSFPAALFSFLRSPRDFKSTVLYAVSLGGDSDTIASMSGAISGAHNGYSNIPPEWLEKLENKRDLKNLADNLFTLYVRRELGNRCEYCRGSHRLRVVKLTDEAGYDLDNLILVCAQCMKEIKRGFKPPHPRKTGKYRAVYRKSYSKSR